MTRDDFKVKWRSDEEVEAIASDVRNRFAPNVKFVNVLNILNDHFVAKLEKNGHLLEIEAVAGLPATAPAEVCQRTNTLRVEHNVLEEAAMGKFEANFVMAHELGHIVLHTHFAQRFSTSGQFMQRVTDVKEESAESQATLFAIALLYPESEFRPHHSVDLVTAIYGLGRFDAEEAIIEYAERSKRRGYRNAIIGEESCPNCGNDILVPSADKLVCMECVPPSSFAKTFTP